MLNIFTILVLRRCEKILRPLSALIKKSQKSEKCCGRKSKANTKVLILFDPIGK